MKKFKLLFFGFIVFIFTLGIVGYFPTSIPAETTLSASDKTDYNPLNYISLVSEGQVLTEDNITNLGNNAYSIMINGPTTINLNPFDSLYKNEFEFDETYFTLNTVEVMVEYGDKSVIDFEYKGKTIYVYPEREGSGQLRNYYTFSYDAEDTTSEKPIPPKKLNATTLNTSAIICEEIKDPDRENYVSYLKFTIKDSVTVHVASITDLADIKYTAIVAFSGKGQESRNFTLKFFRPVIKFANAETPFLKFESFKDYNAETKNYDFYEVDSLLQSEETFNKVRLTFLNDEYEYSKENPLYFRINFNGFSYNFTFYSEIINDENCLIVQYTDEISNTTKQLATECATRETQTGPITEFVEKVPSNSQFTMNFTYRGRYEIEFYDNTYIQNFANPNYYKTTFYLKNDSNPTNSADSKFNDMYILAQSIDDEQQPIEYIVNTATLNTSVKVTLKNVLEDKLESYEEGGVEKFKNELADIIDRIDITITIYGTSSGNHPVKTSYYPITEENQSDTSVKHLLDVFSIDENGDYYMLCHEDAHYKICIVDEYQRQVLDKDGKPAYNQKGEPLYEPATKEIVYIFSILKSTKASFAPVSDNPGDDPNFDSSFTATEPYKTIYKEYTNKIKNSDPIQIYLEYQDQTPLKPTRVLDITYNNIYTVKYGMQVAEIKYGVNEDNNAITFFFYGVGDMIAEITFKGVTTQYSFNSEENDNSITFTEYGKYQVKLVDSMNTAAAPENINFSKGLNFSALALIGLSCLIVAFIAIFVVSVRGRIKTR